LMPETTLSGSKPYGMTAGLWRYGPGGILEEGFYNYDNNTLGPYTFKDPYGYGADFYVNKPTPPVRLLYQAMQETNAALAAYFVNNTYIGLLFEDGIKYLGIKEEYMDFIPHKKPVTGIRQVIDVGVVKTYMVCADVPRMAYKLQMDLDTGMVYLGKDKWVLPPTFPKLDADFSFQLYKDLVQNPDAYAVMLDNDGNKVYLKEE
jgi:hypothetical protein